MSVGAQGYLLLSGGPAVWAHVAKKVSDSVGWFPSLWWAPGAATETKAILRTAFPTSHELNADFTALRETEEDFTPEHVDLARQFFSSDFYLNNREAINAEIDRTDDFTMWAGESRTTVSFWVVLELVRLFDKHNVRALVAAETPHGLVGHMSMLIAEYRGLPVLYFHPIPFVPVLMPMTPIGNRWRSKSKSWSLSCMSERQLLGEIIVELNREIDLLSSGNMPDYMTNKKSLGLPDLPLTLVGRILQITAWLQLGRSFLGVLLNPRNINLLLKRAIGKSLALWRRADSMVFLPRIANTQQIPRGPRATLFLHYEPERNANPEGRPNSSALDALLKSRAFFPPAWQLLVRDHPSQSSLRRWGYKRRSSTTLSFFNKFYSSTVFSTGKHSGELIRTSQATVTVNGNVGIQSVLAGVPVYYMGHPWWTGLPGSVRMREDFVQPESIEIPSENLVRTFLEDLILQKCVVGIASLKSIPYWSEKFNLTETYWEEQLKGLTQVFEEFF